MSDYTEILNRTRDQMPKDKVLPEGSWLLRGSNVTFQKSNDPEKSDRFLFVYSVKEPMSDVDAQALEALGDFDVKSKQVFYTIWVQRNKDWDTIEYHLAKHGIVWDDKTPLQTCMSQFKGSEVIAWLGTKTFTAKSGETVTDNDPTVFEPVS